MQAWFSLRSAAMVPTDSEQLQADQKKNEFSK